MKDYRKKPVIIQAQVWFNHGDLEQVVKRYEAPSYDSKKCPICKKVDWRHGSIKTLEGEHIVCPGDYIIKGVKGEFYPCKPDIFELTYDFVEVPEV